MGHPFYDGKFILKKKVEYSHCYDINIKTQPGVTPLSLGALIKCKKLETAGKIDEVLKYLENMSP